MELATDVAGRYLDKSHVEGIRAALPSLLRLAEPRDSLFHPFKSSHPEALVAAHHAAPGVVQDAIQESLRSRDKYVRQSGAVAVITLLKSGASVDAAEIASSLIASFRLPDDFYDAGPASATAAKSLSLLLQSSEAVDPLLDRYLDDGDEEVQRGVLLACIETLRNHAHAGPEEEDMPVPALTSTEVKAFQRILRVLASLPNDERLSTLNDFIRSEARRLVSWDVATDAAVSLLGIAAMACQQANESTRGSSIIQDPRPKELRELEHGTRALCLSGLANALVEYVAWIANNHPNFDARLEVLELFFETLRPLPRYADHFRSTLVEELGKLGSSHTQKARVIPEIYSALMHSSPRVRSAACAAYADLCGRLGTDCLPFLLHESFLVLLGDPYVAVHKRAVKNLRRSRLPSRYRRTALAKLQVIVLAYAENNEDGYFLIEALTKLLVFSEEDSQLFEHFKQLALTIACRQSVNIKYQFMREAGHFMRDTPGYGDLVLDLPITGERFDHRGKFVLGELNRLPGYEIHRLAQRIVAVGEMVARRRAFAVMPLLSLLNEHGEWDTAGRLANAAVLACGPERSGLPQRLRLSVYAKALQLELALEERRQRDVNVLIDEIRTLEAEIARDEEINRERRDVFPRIPATDSDG